MPRQTSRRRFLQLISTSAVAGPLIISGHAQGAPGPNERIQVGFIGVGAMGRGHLSRLLGEKDVQVLAVCDVVTERRESARKMVEDRYAADKDKPSYKGCQIYNDFRELLQRSDIDAVVIATPDHWHAIPCVMAANAKKDIYCEKPLTHSIAEGRKIVEAVSRNNVVFQTGSQQRSEFGNRFRLAVELVRSGRIGKLDTIRIGVGGPPRPCDLPEQPIPEGTDWDLWLGPAAKRPYNEALCPKGVHQHFPAWRSYREFGGGGLADMGAHHFDIAQWALDMDRSGPIKIEPPARGDTDLKFIYASGVVMRHGGPADCVFEGNKGTIHVSRGKIESLPGNIVKEPIGEKDFHVYPSSDHMRNWLDCIRSRKETICPAETGHRSATICHLANLAYELRRDLKWDPEKEQFVGDTEANTRLDSVKRAPWNL